jgi:hypothetical protein
MTSQGARGGFSNERDAIGKINSLDKDALEWLEVMGYDVKKIVSLSARKADPGLKPDIVVTIQLKGDANPRIERLSAKLASQNRGFNQIDRGKVVGRYQRLWSWLNEDTSTALRLFTGDMPPRSGSRNPKRMFADELNHVELDNVLKAFEQNKRSIFETIFAGAKPNRADWFLGRDSSRNRWFICTMDFAIDFYSQGPVALTPRGSFKIGKITAQRKGGDGGAETAKDLQFKFDPNEIAQSLKI